jgi:predicted ATPase
LAQAVYTHTEGNPLFVTEVVRLLVQEGGLSDAVGAHGRAPLPPGTAPRDSWTVGILEGVREVIGHRLNRLSQRCNQTLTTAAVIGREFSLEQLKPLIDDTTEDRLLEVLEEALAARVIEELPRSVGRYQFSHALIQETLAGELSTTRKVRLHARIAEALEKLYGQQAEAHAAELARHFAEAESMLGTEKVVKYSLRAIDLPRRVDDPPAMVMAHFYVARAQDFIGGLDQARVHTAAMLSAAERLRDQSWLTWAYWMSGTLSRLEGNWRAARGFLDRGLAIAPRDPTLFCTRGVLEYETGDFGQGATHMERLLEVMRQTAPGPIHEYA